MESIGVCDPELCGPHSCGSVKPENTGLMPWVESAPTRLAANSEYKTPEDLLGQWLMGKCPREGDCSVPARQLRVLGETPDFRDVSGHDGSKNGLVGRFPTQGYSWPSPRLGREPLAQGMRSWLRWGLEQDGHEPLRVRLCE